MMGFSVARLVCRPSDLSSVGVGAVARVIRRRKERTGRRRSSMSSMERPYCAMEEETRRSSGPLNAVMGKGAYRGDEAESCDDARAPISSEITKKEQRSRVYLARFLSRLWRLQPNSITHLSKSSHGLELRRGVLRYIAMAGGSGDEWSRR